MQSRKRIASLFVIGTFCCVFAWSQSASNHLRGDYHYWLNEDVRYIVTPEERAAFLKLSTDQQRDQFIAQFWLRRDPTPDTLNNEFKDELYRRYIYANEQFSTGVTPGWASDRGRIYIFYGPPDNIESSSVAGPEGKVPAEVWHYRYLEAVGVDINVEFVDTCRCNAYDLTIDKSLEDVLNHRPLPAPTQRQDTIIDLLTRSAYAPQPKFKDLEELVAHETNASMVPLSLRVDFVKVTSFTDLVPVTITVRNGELKFVTKDGVATATLRIFGRVTTTQVVDTFEDTVQVQMPAELLPGKMDDVTTYWKALPLPHGDYRLAIAVKDVTGDRVGTAYRNLVVQEYKPGHLATSSLMLLRQMSPATGPMEPFVLGAIKTKPAATVFQRKGQLNLWIQVYGLGIDASTLRPSARVDYHIANAKAKSVLDFTESPEAFGRQITLQKTVPLARLEPGAYRVIITVTDNVMNATAITSAKFLVK